MFSKFVSDKSTMDKVRTVLIHEVNNTFFHVIDTDGVVSLPYSYGHSNNSLHQLMRETDSLNPVYIGQLEVADTTAYIYSVDRDIEDEDLYFINHSSLERINNRSFNYDLVSQAILSSFKLHPQMYEDKWYKSYGICIPLLLVAYKKMRPGEQHRVLRSLLQYVNDKWESTYIHNTHDHVRWLLKQYTFHRIETALRYYGISSYKRELDRIKYAPQIFEKAGVAASNTLADKVLSDPLVSDTLTHVGLAARTATVAFTDVMNTSKYVNQKIDDAADSFNLLLKQATSKLNAISDSISSVFDFANIARIIVCTISYFYQLSILYLHGIKAIAAATMNYLFGVIPYSTSGVLENIQKCLLLDIQGIIQLVKGKVGSFIPQSNENSSYRGLAESLFNVIKSHIPGCNASDYKINSDMLDKHMKNIKNVKSLFEILMNVFLFVWEHVGGLLTRRWGYVPKCVQTELGTTFHEYVEFKRGDWTTRAREDPETARRLSALRNDLAQHLNDLNDDVVSIHERKDMKFHETLKTLVVVRSAINTMTQEVTKAYNALPPYMKLDGGSVSRDKPFFLHLFGAPRIGKTACVQPIIIAELLRNLKFVNKHVEQDITVFSRNPESEYWEGYHHQIVVTYNDAFQINANKEATMMLLNELTQVVDDNPYPLNMADVADKGKNYFNSPIVVMNTQENITAKFIADKCWSNGTHFYNRRNIVIELILSDKYRRTDGTPGINYEAVHAAKTGLCYGNIPHDMYKFRFYSPNDQNRSTLVIKDSNGKDYPHESGVVSFGAGMDYIIRMAKYHFQQQNLFKSAQDKFMQEQFENPVTWFTPQSNEKVTYNINDDFVILPTHDNECACFNVLSKAIEEGLDNEDPLLVEFIKRRGEHVCATDYATLIKDYRLGYMRVFKMGKLQQLIAEWPDTKLKIKNFFNSQPVKIAIGALAMVGLVIGAVLLYRSHTSDDDNEELETHSMERLKVAQQRKVLKRVTQSHEKLSIKQSKVMRLRLPQGGYTTIRDVRPQYNEKNSALQRNLVNNFARVEYYLRTEDGLYDMDKAEYWTCVGGQLYMIPRHYYARIQLFNELKGASTELKFIWANANKQATYVDIQYMTFIEPQDIGMHQDNDIVFVHVKNMSPCPKYYDDFISIKDRPRLSDSSLIGYSADKTYGVTFFDAAFLESTPLPYEQEPSALVNLMVQQNYLPKEAVKVVQFELPTYYKYRCPTKLGDCGKILMHTDDRFNSKIMGMHVAGDSRFGVAVAVFREDIYKVLDLLEKADIDNTTICQYAEYDSGMTNPNCKLYESFGLNVIGATPDMIDYNGKKRNIRTTLPNKTPIHPTAMYEEIEKSDIFGPHIQEPAAFAPFVNEDGEKVSPFNNGIKKLANYSQNISADDYDAIKDHIVETIRSYNVPAQDNKDILSDFEMVNGTSILNSMDMTTAAGFPFDFLKAGTKKVWFEELPPREDGRKTYEMGKELTDILAKREKEASENVISHTIFKDTLKVNETRPIEKVKLGKTRIFQVGPMDLVLLTRKYCGRFMEVCHTSFIVGGEISIGINCDGPDFDIAFKRMMTFRKFINGDYSNYDSTLPFWVAEMSADIVNKWYDDSTRNQRIRKALLLACFCGLHISGDVIHFFRQGNPSGCSWTTIFNCIANMAFIRYAYIRLYGSLKDFHSNVCPMFYGDDNLIGINEHVCPDLNMITYESIMKTIGITYTNTSKTAIKVPFVDRADISYLKRTVKYDPKYGYVSMLDKDVIYNIPRWCEGDRNVENLTNQVNSVMGFMWAYGKKDYNIVRNELLRINSKLPLADRIDGTRVKTYDDITCDRYGPQRVDSDLASMIAKSLKQCANLSAD